MQNRASWTMSSLFVLILVGLVELSATRARASQDQAEEIVRASGVRGGLIVHLGCGDGRLTAALRLSDRTLVHGLDASGSNVAAARDHIRSQGLYGPVSVDAFDGRRLPYAENLVNLVVAEHFSAVPMEEILRVLVPEGVALIRGDGGWEKTVKPRPEEIDEWTHWMHEADGNAVAADRVVGPPRRLQWAAAPLWSRHHDTVPSTSAMVTSGGRLFYISDEAPACLDGSVPDRWFLVGRDAFNGVLLWKRPIADWGWAQWCADWLGRFNIPPHLPKRVVAAGDRVYATLGFNAPLAQLDAATGEVLQVYEGTENTDEILYREGLLVLSLNLEARRPAQDDRDPVKKSVCVVEAASGKMLWKEGSYAGLRAKYNSSEPFGRLELASGGDQVFLVDQDAIVSLDLQSGRRRWRVPRPQFNEHRVMYNIRMSDQGVLVYQDGVLLFAQPEMLKNRSWHTLPGTLHAWRAADGEPMWSHAYGGWSHNWQPDVFVVDGLVWLHEHVDAPMKGHDVVDKDEVEYAVIGLDLKTGELRRRFSTKESFNVGHHHRCYRGKATERFLIASRRGAEFLDLATEENHLNHWARGACLHGFVPANGLLYLSPHPCECYIASKLNGYYALAPAGDEPAAKSSGTLPGQPRFERDPAYGVQLPSPASGRGGGGEGGTAVEPASSERKGPDSTADSPHPATSSPPSPASGRGKESLTSSSLEPQVSSLEPHDWPTFRHDPARSGATASSVPGDLQASWRAELGGRLSPPTVADGKLFLASMDDHRVVALDAASGEQVWDFTAGGRVDTPPTIHDGRAYFGSADGWVYSLRAADGRLCWRRRLAPRDRLVGAFGQIESAWPIHGGVLIENGVVYAAAGRSSYLDGGIILAALDPATGDVIDEKVLHSPDPQTGNQPPGDARTIPGTLTDVLVSDGSSISMRGETVFGDAPASNRHLSTTAGFRDPSWFNRTQWSVGTVPRAQMLVFDGQTAYGVAAYSGSGRHKFIQPGGEGYTLFAQPWRPPDANDGKRTSKATSRSLWRVNAPVRFNAMAVAGRTLIAAGAPDVVDPDDPLGAFEGHQGARLWLVSTDDGKKITELELPSLPVYDGLAVAAEKLYLTTAAGDVLCFAGPMKP